MQTIVQVRKSAADSQIQCDATYTSVSLDFIALYKCCYYYYYYYYYAARKCYTANNSGRLRVGERADWVEVMGIFIGLKKLADKKLSV